MVDPSGIADDEVDHRPPERGEVHRRPGALDLFLRREQVTFTCPRASSSSRIRTSPGRTRSTSKRRSGSGSTETGANDERERRSGTPARRGFTS